MTTTTTALFDTRTVREALAEIRAAIRPADHRAFVRTTEEGVVEATPRTSAGGLLLGVYSYRVNGGRWRKL